MYYEIVCVCQRAYISSRLYGGLGLFFQKRFRLLFAWHSYCRWHISDTSELKNKIMWNSLFFVCISHWFFVSFFALLLRHAFTSSSFYVITWPDCSVSFHRFPANFMLQTNEALQKKRTLRSGVFLRSQNTKII